MDLVDAAEPLIEYPPRTIHAIGEDEHSVAALMWAVCDEVRMRRATSTFFAHAEQCDCGLAEVASYIRKLT